MNCLVTEVSGDYLQGVLQRLSSCSSEVLNIVKQSIIQAGKSLRDLLPLVMNAVIEALTEKSVEVSFELH